MTQQNRIKQILILAILVILVVGFILLINKFIFDQSTINFQPIQNSSIEILSTNSHYSLTINSYSKKTIPNGSYTVIYSLNSKNYQPVSKIININHSLTLTLTQSQFPYSQLYLSNLLTTQQNNLKQAFLNSQYSKLISSGQYSFDPVEIFGNNGQWAFIRLIPSNILNSSSLLTIMKQTKTSWSVLTQPSIYLTKYNTANIPVQYLEGFNQIGSLISNINNPQINNQLINLTTKYIQQYENRDSSYQSSPSNWLTFLNGDLTSNFLNNLKGQYSNVGSAGTGLISSNYQINHQSDYSIIAKINNCLVQQINSNSYTVACNVTNQVVNNKTQQPIKKQSIPFGYTLNSQQIGVSVNIINQNNQYQINSTNSF